jgi:XTP/dITP diphosphohydrolase
MMEIVFATHNNHKLHELVKLMPDNIKLLSLHDIGQYDEIPEDGDTLNHNASLKAWHVYNKYGKNCFADDTGLEVEALNNEPGVYSARYAGEEKDASKNMAKLLQNLNGHSNRKARFRTIISLIVDGTEHQFEGCVEGSITLNTSGNKGFGYDPIFLPDGYDKTFAQLSLDEKNKISHRAKAVEKLLNYLNTQNINS